MKETISIENFGGLKKISVELKDINLIIGPQASGKSVIAKLLFFFKNFPIEILDAVQNGETKRVLDAKLKSKFITYFPIDSWPKGNFEIAYKTKGNAITIQRKTSKTVSLTYSENYKNLFDRVERDYKDELNNGNSYKISTNVFQKFIEAVKNDISEKASYSQIFIPAGRSFFSNIQSNLFSFLSKDESIDPFFIEFGKYYERFKRLSLKNDIEKNINGNHGFDTIINNILYGNLIREKDKDFVVHDDLRKVNLASASSGQQEIIPLLVSLKTLNFARFGLSDGTSLYIEEPEAHLFPTAQKKIVQLLARTFNSKRNQFQIIVTTHSPYILSSFNNLLEAGKIIDEQPDKTSKVHKVVSKEEVIYPGELAAFSVFGGKKKGLMDKETKLISQNLLDAVSDEIAVDFGKLLDIEY